MGDIALLLREIFAAQPAYLEAKAYSDGKKNEVWATKKLGQMLSKTANRYRVNIARRPIDAVLDRLEITEVSVADDPEMTKVLTIDVFDDNQLDLELPDAFDLAETYGDAYVMCWPRPDEPGAVDVFVNDPINMRVLYDPENPRRKVLAGRTWLDSDNFRRVTLWRDGPRVERFISTKKEDSQQIPSGGYKDADFVPFLADAGNQDSWFEDLALGLGNPVFHLRTGRPYGKPEHEQAYGTQNMLTKQIATMMDATDGYGFPFRYMLSKLGTTGPVASLSDEWDDDETPRAPTATNFGDPSPIGGRRSDQQTSSDPGTIAKLTDVDAVGQLQPADVGNFLDPISMTLRLSSVVTNTPLNYFDPSAASASGESKKEHEKPAVNKANRRLRSYDGTAKDALAYALALLGHVGLKVMISWAPTASVDEAAELNVAAKRREVGVPFITFMTQLGYPEKEVQRWVDEATPDDEVLEHRVGLLKELAQAAQALGAAATLGVIDTGEAKALITQMMIKETPAITPPAGQ